MPRVARSFQRELQWTYKKSLENSGRNFATVAREMAVARHCRLPVGLALPGGYQVLLGIVSRSPVGLALLGGY